MPFGFPSELAFTFAGIPTPRGLLGFQAAVLPAFVNLGRHWDAGAQSWF
jgi:hypothetical protein